MLAGIAIGVLFVVVGCSTARRSQVTVSPVQPVVLLTPHWDQVCYPSRDPLVVDRPADVLDTAAVTRMLDDVLPPSRSSGADPFVDVAIHYNRSGAIRTAHLQQHNVADELARTVSESLTESVRPQGLLLEPVYLRVRATLTPRLRLELLPAIHCMPHVWHERGEPPRFLGSAGVWSGGRCGRPVTERCIQVRLHISPAGELERIEVLGGKTSLVERVRESVTKTRFDPALLNRVPVSGALDLIFDFKPPRSTGLPQVG